jgi:hypothetical protein
VVSSEAERLIPLCLGAILFSLGGLVISWNLAGREVVRVTPGELVLRKEVFGLGSPREFDRSQVADLRVAPLVYNPWDWNAGLAVWGLGGTLAFDYGAKTYRFGIGLDEAEAKMILAAIQQHLAGKGSLTAA